MPTRDRAIADVKGWTVWELQRAADCMSPDSTESPGAAFLTRVRDAVIEAIEYEGDAFDRDSFDISSTIDDAPSVYTYTLWTQFVDLGAWQEDPTEYGHDGADMETGARTCLYIIADRLAHAIIAAVADADDDENEGADDE